MPTLVVGMWTKRDKRVMPTASVGMAPAAIWELYRIFVSTGDAEGDSPQCHKNRDSPQSVGCAKRTIRHRLRCVSRTLQKCHVGVTAGRGFVGVGLPWGASLF